MSTCIEKGKISARVQKRTERQKQRERTVRILWMSIISCFVFITVTTAVIAAGKLRIENQEEEPEVLVEEQVVEEQVVKEQPVQSIQTMSKKEYPYHPPVDYSYSEAVLQIGNLCEEYPEFETVYKNFEQYPKELIIALANNPDMLSFVEGYLAADTAPSASLTDVEKSEKVPHLLQWDKRWGYVSYGDDNIALSGCAPTCLSMVIIALTGNTEITPDQVGKYAMENGYYLYGTGTTWEMMSAGCRAFGIQGEITELNKENVETLLEQGTPMICSMVPGEFTTGGHFIVLAGMENGKIRVNDPNSKVRSEKLWDFETLASQIKGIWTFSKI